MKKLALCATFICIMYRLCNLDGGGTCLNANYYTFKE